MADNSLLFEGRSSMGWRNKVLVVLVIYFAGFATAIYALAPACIQAAGQTVPSNQPRSFSHSFVKSNDFAMSFNSGIQTCIQTGSDAALRTGEFIKQKLSSHKEGATTIARNQ
jgi:hypothetical protein